MSNNNSRNNDNNRPSRLGRRHSYNGGFSTSLCDLFSNNNNPQDDRSSFCALTCCATFLQDRNEYILSQYYQNQQQQQSRPLDWWLRLLLYIGVSIILYISVNRYYYYYMKNGGGSSNKNEEDGQDQDDDNDDNENKYYGIIAVIIFLVLLSVRATWKRAHFRRNVLQLVHSLQQQQDDNEQEVDDDENDDVGLCSQNQRVHYTCSLVLKDNDDCGSPCCACGSCCCCNSSKSHSAAAAAAAETSSSLLLAPHNARRDDDNDDACTNLWNCLAASCCGCLGCWWNCCGVCATAQEERELRRLLPRRSFYIDYITFEPWSHYFPKIQVLRRRQHHNESSSFWQHFQATSELSRLLLKILVLTLVLLMMASGLHLVRDFSYPKVLVICATLVQAFLVLYFCHWQDHRFDLSLDAVIKLFASGFCFATVFSMIVEQVLTAVGINVLGLALGILNANASHAPTDTTTAAETYHDGHDAATTTHNNSDNVNHAAFYVNPRDYQHHNDDDESSSSSSHKSFFLALVQQYPYAYIVYLFFSAYIVAGTVEEMAKYFCFWMVEHPDFVYDDDDIDNDDNNNQQQEPAPPLQQQAAASSSSSSNGAAITAVADNTVRIETQPLLVTSTSSSSQYGTSTSPPQSQSQLIAECDNGPSSSITRTFRSRAAAITVAMIATAAGFACLENLIYVFGTGFGTSLKGEITILLFRSALPVHPLCAAIQSIGIVKRDIENRYRNVNSNRQQQQGHVNGNTSSSSSSYYYGLGRAMFPAIILHGTFDFVLFVLGFLSTLYASNNNNNGDDNENETTTFSMIATPSPSSSSSPWWTTTTTTTTTGTVFNDGGIGSTITSSYNRVTGNYHSSHNKNDDDVTATSNALESSLSLLVWMNLLSLFAGPVIFVLGVVYYYVESFKQRSRLDAMDEDAAAAMQQQHGSRLRRGHVPPVAVVTGLA